jgi:calcineurin-like phosphoesterase family protein
MSQVWFCSDLHLGHKRIERFRAHVKDEEDNLNKCVTSWNKLVTKRDLVYVLGDAAFTSAALETMKSLPGRKYLVRGNHDTLRTADYLTCFEEVYGLYKYHEFWLSHAPIHTLELRNRPNLHGHVHYYTLEHPMYFNMCSENLIPFCGEWLISLDKIREHFGNILRRGNDNKEQGTPIQSG